MSKLKLRKLHNEAIALVEKTLTDKSGTIDLSDELKKEFLDKLDEILTESFETIDELQDEVLVLSNNNISEDEHDQAVNDAIQDTIDELGIPKVTLEDDLKLKILQRLSKNFTLNQLEYIEVIAKDQLNVNLKTYQD